MINWHKLEKKLGIEIQRKSSLSGGDISSVYKIEAENKAYVLKINDASSIGLFQTEKAGMQLLQEANALIIPEIHEVGKIDDKSYLLMEFIPKGQKHDNTFLNFGKDLARIHKNTQTHYGLNHDNWIGHLPQSNKTYKNWSSFYYYERIKPQLDLAKDRKYLTDKEIPEANNILSSSESIFCPSKPSLLHGDLWNGNFLITENGKVALIDPAVYYGHPMMDIGMTKLFGGFEASFYTSYFENTDITGNIDAQVDLAQLYYLLVHLNLFGTSYKSQVNRIIYTYF